MSSEVPPPTGESRPLRIAQVAPVATTVPPAKSGSIESMTALLTDGLVARGHHVTLFATGGSRTSATLHASFPRGYGDDPALWPWEMYELFNIAAAFERASEFDVVHCHARYQPLALPFSHLSSTPVIQTVHHAPSPTELGLWERYPEAPFVAVSVSQARLMQRLNVIATVPHGLDIGRFRFSATPGDYVVFLGRFTPGKGPLEAITAAKRLGLRILLAAEANDYYREAIASHVDGEHVVYAGEVDHDAKVALLGGARALIYPLQADESFGLVPVEAAACGTPTAAIDRGAVREVVVDGVTGQAFSTLDDLLDGLPGVIALDRAHVRAAAVERFGVDRMVDGYVAAYRQLVATRATAGGAR